MQSLSGIGAVSVRPVNPLVRVGLSAPGASLECADDFFRPSACGARRITESENPCLPAQTVLGRVAVFQRRAAAGGVFRHLPGVFSPAGSQLGRHRPAQPARPVVDGEILVGAGGRLGAASPLVGQRCQRRHGRSDALLRGPGGHRRRRSVRAVGLAGDRRVHRAVGHQRHRDRRLHHRTARPTRIRHGQWLPDRLLPGRHDLRRRGADVVRLVRLERGLPGGRRGVCRQCGDGAVRTARAPARFDHRILAH